MPNPAAQGEESELIVEQPWGDATRISLDHERYALGRSSSNQLAFPEDNELSREHLVFERGNSGWFVRDVGSRNGTKVNGVPLAADAARLSDGDRISAGHLTIRFRARAPAPKSAEVDRGATVSLDLKSALANATGESGTPNLRNEHLGALVRAGRELIAQGSVDELCALVLDLAADVSKAARGAVFTLSTDGSLVSRAERGRGLKMSSAVQDIVLKERRSLLVRDARLENEFGFRASIVAQDIRSILAVPLQTDENAIGLIYLDSPFFVREFTADDLNVVTVLANIAAIRIEHARSAEEREARRLLDQDLARAAEIQQGILPKDPPPVSACDLAAFNLPCRTVGGDYYNFITYPDGQLALFVADVSGKGLPAALLVSSLHACIRLLFDEAPKNLSDHVYRLNKTVSNTCPLGCFITFFVGLFDPATGNLVYCNAGHNPPLLVRAAGAQSALDSTGIPLGLFADACYDQQSCAVDPGDTLLLYSDGVTEACAPESNDEFGEARLFSALATRKDQTAKTVVSEINSDVLLFTRGAAPADDRTLVILRRAAGNF